MTSNAKARQGVTTRIRSTIVEVIKTMHIPRITYGLVVAVSTTTPTCSVELNGTTTIITGVKYSTAFVPVLFDPVVCFRVGTDLFIMGKIQDAGVLWQRVQGGVGYSAGWAEQTFSGVFTEMEFCRVNDRVYLRGLVVRASGTNQPIFTLPAGYRPVLQELFVVDAGGAFGEVQVEPTGPVIFTVGTATSYVGLSGISFSVRPQ